jgi:hypothetical protein
MEGPEAEQNKGFCNIARARACLSTKKITPKFPLDSVFSDVGFVY